MCPQNAIGHVTPQLCLTEHVILNDSRSGIVIYFKTFLLLLQSICSTSSPSLLYALVCFLLLFQLILLNVYLNAQSDYAPGNICYPNPDSFSGSDACLRVSSQNNFHFQPVQSLLSFPYLATAFLHLSLLANGRL